MPRVELKNVTHAYRDDDLRIRTLGGISLSVEEGEILSLVCVPGAGASTLLGVVAGVLETDDGVVLVDGLPVDGPAHSAGLIGAETGLLSWLTLAENIEAGRALGGDVQTGQVLALLGLTGEADRYPSQVTAVHRSLATLGRALVNSPRVLLFDDPFRVLSPTERASVRGVVATTLKGIGATAIFATRDIDEALLVGDRVAVLTLRPATVSSVVDNALPFPRDPNDEEFQVLRILLHHQAYLAREGGDYAI